MAEYADSNLLQDIEDMLDVGAVGLYEFVWTLRSERPGTSIDQLRDQAARVLRHLLDTRDIEPILQVWPHSDPVGTFDPMNLGLNAWDDPVLNQPYPALILAKRHTHP
ncbi:hypothetical protein FZI91_09970 [Mycobacterium sp. CBMA271]|uniref:hypothetical protein n=1 Tax=unclassified Mycobacteroides TaxID=2618759 RepID=UPI0012DC4B3D|nr:MULTISPECIES: hypothetical protein [unclassified Mycobacteroides]MUM16662.1 hypothetical protein [Mycobacteroides sp. CBMA 326]MUM22028.1 hypothetical protein [Mycobacteroides sp. CBMA 271]